jgi:hypothetical protein
LDEKDLPALDHLLNLVAPEHLSAPPLGVLDVIAADRIDTFRGVDLLDLGSLVVVRLAQRRLGDGILRHRLAIRRPLDTIGHGDTIGRGHAAARLDLLIVVGVAERRLLGID